MKNYPEIVVTLISGVSCCSASCLSERLNREIQDCPKYWLFINNWSNFEWLAMSDQTFILGIREPLADQSKLWIRATSDFQRRCFHQKRKLFGEILGLQNIWFCPKKISEFVLMMAFPKVVLPGDRLTFYSSDYIFLL